MGGNKGYQKSVKIAAAVRRFAADTLKLPVADDAPAHSSGTEGSCLLGQILEALGNKPRPEQPPPDPGSEAQLTDGGGGGGGNGGGGRGGLDSDALRAARAEFAELARRIPHATASIASYLGGCADPGLMDR